MWTCPIDWYVELSDGGPVSQAVNLSLSVADGRSSTGKKADLIKNCLIFIDPNHIDSRNNCRHVEIVFGHHGLEDNEFDAKAAKLLYRKMVPLIIFTNFLKNMTATNVSDIHGL